VHRRQLLQGGVKAIQAPTTEHLLEMSVHVSSLNGYLLNRFLSPKILSSTKLTKPLVAALDAHCIDKIVTKNLFQLQG
jgi:hypothetical protein